MLLQIVGWILAVVLVLHAIYGMFYHQRSYVALATRARIDPATGELVDRVTDPLAEKRAARYLRSVQIMLIAKLAAAALIVYFLV